MSEVTFGERRLFGQELWCMEMAWNYSTLHKLKARIADVAAVVAALAVMAVPVVFEVVEELELPSLHQRFAGTPEAIYSHCIQ